MYLLKRINSFKHLKLLIPSNTLVEYKEALIFGFLGVLRLRDENNCLSSVTGAKKNHSSGTDRIAEAAVNIDHHIVVNLQGDEPFINKDAISDLINSFKEFNTSSFIKNFLRHKYNCILCKYETSYPSEWIKHTKTKKHEICKHYFRSKSSVEKTSRKIY